MHAAATPPTSPALATGFCSAPAAAPPSSRKRAAAAAKLQLALPALETPDHDCSLILNHLVLASSAVAADAAALRALRVTHIVNLTAHPPCFPDSFTYLYAPLKDSLDGGAALRRALTQACAVIDSAEAQGTRCLVHCSAGMSRSAAVVLAYLMQRQRMTLLEALAFTRSKRPLVSPNSGFMEELCALEADLYEDEVSLCLDTYRMDRFSTAEELQFSPQSVSGRVTTGSRRCPSFFEDDGPPGDSDFTALSAASAT